MLPNKKINSSRLIPRKLQNVLIKPKNVLSNVKNKTNLSVYSKRSIQRTSNRNTNCSNSPRTFYKWEDNFESMPLTRRTKKLKLLGQKFDIFSTKRGRNFIDNLVKVDIESTDVYTDRITNKIVERETITQNDIKFLKSLLKHGYLTNEDELEFKKIALKHRLVDQDSETELQVETVHSKYQSPVNEISNSLLQDRELRVDSFYKHDDSNHTNQTNYIGSQKESKGYIDFDDPTENNESFANVPEDILELIAYQIREIDVILKYGSNISHEKIDQILSDTKIQILIWLKSLESTNPVDFIDLYMNQIKNLIYAYIDREILLYYEQQTSNGNEEENSIDVPLLMNKLKTWKNHFDFKNKFSSIAGKSSKKYVLKSHYLVQAANPPNIDNDPMMTEKNRNVNKMESYSRDSSKYWKIKDYQTKVNAKKILGGLSISQDKLCLTDKKYISEISPKNSNEKILSKSVQKPIKKSNDFKISQFRHKSKNKDYQNHNYSLDITTDFDLNRKITDRKKSVDSMVIDCDFSPNISSVNYKSSNEKRTSFVKPNLDSIENSLN